ncbi:MAG: alpha-L-arabinofuranosidase C-terminal domain-containing protein [Eubacteriales bacterium]|nr:alpha-L-arabinofuranosidase C-terminal domain-containing protein [Eubacteriales bacterium]
MKLVIDTTKKREPLGDLYGIFFEDLNHAADGGLYAELIRNRAFEFDPIDNPDYNHLTGWEVIGTPQQIGAAVITGDPVNGKNPHYLALDVHEPGQGAGIRNGGYHRGISVKAGEGYRFSCWAKREQDPEEPVVVSLREEAGETLAEGSFSLTDRWQKYELTLTPQKASGGAYLTLTPGGRGKVYLDFVSLFPTDTYRGHKNGLRRDLAELLEQLHPKFMRFPGGCLVHDGALDPEARDAQYRWKNTVGPVEGRPARRSNWGYNQTLGLGFYEYFVLCEEIGAKPLPVLSPGYDPHHHREAPLSEMQYFIDEALDLIEFANGPADSKWGSLRADMGHPEPFGMEYLGIGNEEVGEPFFARYKIVADAVRERYPQMKLIGSSGPFAAGGEYERGWRHAREDKADLVDEHYYMAPEWMLANHHRYDSFSPEDPKVFLGEYASWGNTWYNALCEASYMLGLERNAGAVGLACYAPLFCNADYVNWQPDMIWFDRDRSYGTANYYVQKLFMENQGSFRLEAHLEDAPENECWTKEPERITGGLRLATYDSTARYRDICLTDEETGEKICPAEATVRAGEDGIVLAAPKASRFSLTAKVTELEGYRGFKIYFGEESGTDLLCWSVGGWQNQDTSVTQTIRGRGAELSQYLMTVEPGREYELKLQVDGRRVRTFIDGQPFHDIIVQPVVAEPLYVGASLAENGDIVVKAVNVTDQERRTALELCGLEEDRSYPVSVRIMSGWEPEEQNSFEEPEKIVPRTERCELSGSRTEWTFAPRSVTFIRIGREG